jgi:hypothetical protein
MVPDLDPRAQKHMDPTDPDSDPDPQHWNIHFTVQMLLLGQRFFACCTGHYTVSRLFTQLGLCGSHRAETELNLDEDQATKLDHPNPPPVDGRIIVLFHPGLRIRIRIGSGSRRAKMTHKSRKNL